MPSRAPVLLIPRRPILRLSGDIISRGAIYVTVLRKSKCAVHPRDFSFFARVRVFLYSVNGGEWEFVCERFVRERRIGIAWMYIYVYTVPVDQWFVKSVSESRRWIFDALGLFVFRCFVCIGGRWDRRNTSSERIGRFISFLKSMETIIGSRKELMAAGTYFCDCNTDLFRDII